MAHRRHSILLGAIVALVLVPLAGPSRATFPGRNGDLAVAARFTGEPRGLFRFEADGSQRRRIVGKGSWEDIAPAWSPDGTTLAFVSDRTGDRDIWTVVPGSGDPPTNLTETPAAEEWLPTWSPDGRIGFMTQYADAGDTVDVIDADGSGRTTIASPRGDVFGVEWSPKGGRIVFGVGNDRRTAVVAIRPDGTGRARWAGRLPHAVIFDWSPGGGRVLFQGRTRAGRHALFEIATGGEHRIRRLTSPSSVDRDQHGAYAPSGTKVVFVRTRRGVDGLWLLREDGTRERVLRRFADMRLFGVSWQPLDPPA